MIAFVAAATILGQGGPISDPCQLFPGAVSTPDRSIGVFPIPTGGIQAVRLANGQHVWTSAAANWPLDVVGDEVLAAVPDKAQKNAFDVVALNLEDGNVRFTSDSVVLPDWAQPVFGYDEPNGYRFDLTAESFDNHTVLVRWCARSWGGPSGHLRLAEDVQVDAQTGKIEKPFLGAQPRIVSRNLLRQERPDPSLPNSYIVGPETKTDTYDVYLSESSQAQADKRPLKVVAVDPDSGKLIWDMPLGTRSAPLSSAD